MTRLLAALLLCLALVAAGCGGDDSSPDPAAATTESAETATATTEADPPAPPAVESDSDASGSEDLPGGRVDVSDSDVPEEQLALIDDGGPIVDKVDITRFGVLLDRLEQNCPDRRSMIADYIVKSQQLIKDEQGVEVGIKKITEDMADAADIAGAPTEKCASLFATYVSTYSQ